MFARVLSSLAPLVLLPPFLSAQTQVWTPQQIQYKGAPQYQPADLNAVLALKLGGQLGTADVDPALQRLADTGLFADIRYNIDNRSIVFTLTPQPASAMQPVVYSNFVIFQLGELTPLVHARVPLFTGSIPTTGSLQQAVQDALTAILKDKGLPNATVDAIAVAGGGVSFSIGNPPFGCVRSKSEMSRNLHKRRSTSSRRQSPTVITKPAPKMPHASASKTHTRI